MSTKTDKQFTEQCNTIHYITSQCHIVFAGIYICSFVSNIIKKRLHVPSWNFQSGLGILPEIKPRQSMF